MMQHWPSRRIDDLKSRGFAKAGLYDPPGVSGTHVMYVLHHAGPAADLCGPSRTTRGSARSSRLWKGVSKYAGMAVIGLTAAAGLRASHPARAQSRLRG